MAEYNGTIDLISGLRPKNNGTFPLMDAKDIQMPDGTRLSEFNPDTSTPVFNLVELGLPNVPYGHTVLVTPEESVLTELNEALAKGEVGFIFNCEKEDGSVTSYSVTMNPQTIGGITTCFKVVAYNDNKLDYVVIAIVGTAIGVGMTFVENKEPLYPLVSGTGATTIEPDKFYTFGTVDSLDLTLANVNDGYLHEYCFEFIAGDNFSELTVSPSVTWANDPLYEKGRTYQVSIMRGIGVIVG